jgi:AraC family transcriptional regulator
MGGGFAEVTIDDGVQVTSGDVDGLTVTELAFPRDYVQQPFEPELPYLALVLEGSLEKTFPRRALQLGRASALTMPSGARHAARFGPQGARIVVVRPRDWSSPVAPCLTRLVELKTHELNWLAWRLAAELRAADSAAPLAAEGLALELLAAASRDARPARRRRTPAWLDEAEEILRSTSGGCVRLGTLAKAVGVHPSHLAREFRARHGISVGEYGRRLRLSNAAVRLATTDRPLAEIAMEAGFADQSHFTRLFSRHIGLTPARYRAETQRPFQRK